MTLMVLRRGREPGAVAAGAPHGSPVAVTRSGLGELEPPIPQGGLGRGLFELLAARSPSPALERRRRLAMMRTRDDRARLPASPQYHERH
jgi:hypothetical protein